MGDSVTLAKYLSTLALIVLLSLSVLSPSALVTELKRRHATRWDE
jgi:hypothetical protein